MQHVEIKVKESGKSWDEIEAVTHEFKTWKEVSTFAKQLSKQLDKEVRVNTVGSGQGHYFSVVRY